MLLLIKACLGLLSNSKILLQQDDAFFIALIFFEVLIGLCLLKRESFSKTSDLLVLSAKRVT